MTEKETHESTLETEEVEEEILSAKDDELRLRCFCVCFRLITN